jgi:site-specific DNA-cytosine methylase
MTALYRRALLLSAVALMLSPWTALAQAGGTPQDDQQNEQAKRQQNQRRFAMLAQKLNLTDDQKKEWAQINRETNQKVRATRNDDSLNEEQMQAQLRAIHKEHDQRLLAMLTPEQQADLKSFWEDMKKNNQPNNTSNTSPCNQTSDNSKDKDESGLFAGMVPDPDPVPEVPQKKKAAPPR